MPTFIDESGDTGHHATSSRHFRLAAVWFPSESEVKSFRDMIGQLPSTHPRLGLQPGYEFKYIGSRGQMERTAAFFDSALRHEFRFAICSVDKRGIDRHWRVSPKKELHWATATMLSVSLRPAYHSMEIVRDHPLRETVFVDDNRDPEFLSAVAAAFQGLRSSIDRRMGMIRKPKFRNSNRDPAMQLADMVCGAAGDYLDGSPSWFNGIRDRCLDVTELP